jgi:hypothetical protein
LAACSTSGRAAGGTTAALGRGPAASAPLAPTHTLARPTSTIRQPARPVGPAIHNTGNDYTQITRSLITYANWVAANDPDLTLVPRFAAPGSKTDGAARHDVAILARLHRRFVEIENGPATFTVIDGHEPDAAVVRLLQRLVRQEIVDTAGHVTSKRDFATPTTTYTILITRDLDGHWFLSDIEES